MSEPRGIQRLALSVGVTNGGCRQNSGKRRFSCVPWTIAITRDPSAPRFEYSVVRPRSAVEQTNVGLRPTPRLGRSRGPHDPAPLPRRRAVRAWSWRITTMSNSRFSQVLFCAATVLLIVGLIGVRPTAQTAGRTGAAANQADPCAAPANRIIAENCKPGNPSTEWDINGVGDQTIVGFATDISFNVGETARFKVNTD